MEGTSTLIFNRRKCNDSFLIAYFELNIKFLPSPSKSSEVMQKLIDLNERFNDQADLIQDTRSLLLNSSILQISHDNDEVII